MILSVLRPLRLATVSALAAAMAAGCVIRMPQHEPAPGTDVPHPPPVEAAPVPQPAARPSRSAQPSGPGNPPFYDVLGERYHVMPDSAGYREQGIASWYGREFHGRKTSNGEVYDMYGISAAHKTLPLPTRARVTHLGTGKSIVVRVNDRGPFKKGRIIDLSYGAARELGMLSAGTAMVEVEALPDADSPGPLAAAPPERSAPRQMYVQVGAFGERANAESLKRRLEQNGFDNVVIRYDARGSSPLHRVRIGPVADAAGFDDVVRRIDGLDLGTPQLIVEAAATGIQ